MVFDSGIGGLTVLDDLCRAMPSENFIYIADNKNTPYGSLPDSTLLRFSLNSLSVLSEYCIKGLVLGCNTLSVSVRRDLERILNYPVFGVFPPIESSIFKGERVLLLATPKTVCKYPNYSNLTKLSLPTLAKEIEDNAFNLSNINLNNHIAIKKLQKLQYDRVILGCTHYFFIKNKILDHFCPKNIDSGNHFTVDYVSKFFLKRKSLGKTYRKRILFLGDNAEKNKKIYYEVVKKHYFC